MSDGSKSYFAPLAWVNGAWAKDVLLSVASHGTWASVQANATPDQQRDAVQLTGPVLPGLVNAHSHAFQRAIAGMAERAGPGQDNFWSWRDRMYSAAQRITPQQLEAIAALLYAELLQVSGITASFGGRLPSVLNFRLSVAAAAAAASGMCPS